MEATLFQKLSEFITENNPEMVVNADRNFSLSQYVNDKIESVFLMLKRLKSEGKPGYVIEEMVMKELTQDLLPSRANYIRSILEDEFRSDYDRFSETGVLTYEVVNLIEKCEEVFETHEFSIKKEGNRFLRYAVIAEIHDYLVDRH